VGCPGNRVSLAPLAVMRPVGMGLRSDALGAVATQEIVCSPRVRKDEGGGAVCGVLGMWAGVGVMGAAVRPATVLGGSAGFSCGLPRGHSRGYEVVSCSVSQHMWQGWGGCCRVPDTRTAGRACSVSRRAMGHD